MLLSPWGSSPVSFEQISQTSFFSWRLLTWFGTFTLGSAASQGMVISTCHLQGRCSLVRKRSPVSLVKIIPSIKVAIPGMFARAPDPWKVSPVRMEQWNVVSSYVTWTLYLEVPARNSQGNCPMVRATSPEDRRSIPKTPLKQCCPE